MVSLLTTAILVSNKNSELAFQLNNKCKELKINIIYVLNCLDLSFKVSNIKPDLIFYDLSTINISSDMLDFLISDKHFKSAVNVFITDDNNFLANKVVDHTYFTVTNNANLSEKVEKLFYSLELINRNKNKSVLSTHAHQIISNYIKDLGISPKHCGFSFIKNVIECTIENFNSVLPPLSVAYSFLSSKFKTKTFNIERDIRHAITAAWLVYGNKKWTNNFKLYVDEQRKPTNREFLSECLEDILFLINKQKN